MTPVRRIAIGIKTSPQAVDWPTLDGAWARIGEHDVFDSAWMNDHLTDISRERHGPSFEALTAMAALVRRVPGKWVGHAMLSATFRHPAVLAKAATVLDHATGGRFIVGLGAGWHEGEHLPFGIPLPSMPERFDRFESAVHVLRALWSDAARVPPGVTRPDPFIRWPRRPTSRRRGRRADRRSGSVARNNGASPWRPRSPTAGRLRP